MTTRINKSWREQRKSVVMIRSDTNEKEEWISIWEASHIVAKRYGCQPETAKKEIKKSISSGRPRYEGQWRWA